MPDSLIDAALAAPKILFVLDLQLADVPLEHAEVLIDFGNGRHGFANPSMLDAAAERVNEYEVCPFRNRQCCLAEVAPA